MSSDPFAGLDPKSRARLAQLIASMVGHILELGEERRGGKVLVELNVDRDGVVKRSSRLQPPWEFPIDDT